jgi:predicted alpha/beta-fold hydrolase
VTGGASLVGHLWTIAPRLRHAVAPREAPAAGDWTTTLVDPVAGEVRLSGRLRDEPRSAALVLVVHGLGGSALSHYAVRMARAAARAGVACLRLNLRGADRRGDDFYHAGLTADVHAALADPALARYERVALIGYSLGGHLVLRAAAEGLDRRVRAAAAVSTPLDLALSCATIDRPQATLYRRYVMRSLKEIYAAVAARRPVPLPPAAAAAIESLRRWDEAIVAPRHGFASADEYYRTQSAAPRLRELRLPTLLVEAENDPMVPASTVRPWLKQPLPGLEVHWVPSGGHAAFPSRLDLGLGGGSGLERGLEAQILAWLGRQ